MRAEKIYNAISVCLISQIQESKLSKDLYECILLYTDKNANAEFMNIQLEWGSIKRQSEKQNATFLE